MAGHDLAIQTDRVSPTDWGSCDLSLAATTGRDLVRLSPLKLRFFEAAADLLQNRRLGGLIIASVKGPSSQDTRPVRRAADCSRARPAHQRERRTLSPRAGPPVGVSVGVTAAGPDRGDAAPRSRSRRHGASFFRYRPNGADRAHRRPTALQVSRRRRAAARLCSVALANRRGHALPALASESAIQPAIRSASLRLELDQVELVLSHREGSQLTVTIRRESPPDREQIKSVTWPPI